MALRTARLALVLGSGLAVAAFACNDLTNPDCGDVCARLDSCGFLPSILGANPSSDTSAAVNDCNYRCNQSTSGGPYTQIDDCFQTSGSPSCSEFAECLHSEFPDSPITGASRLTLRAESTPYAPILAHDMEMLRIPSGPLPIELLEQEAGVVRAAVAGCDEDGGGAASSIRAFVEPWGIRRYSELRACELPNVVIFEDVPADDSVVVGFQLFLNGTCQEYSKAVSVAAGSAGLTAIEFELNEPSVPCPLDAPIDAGGNDG